jgi:hypothetical protein
MVCEEQLLLTSEETLASEIDAIYEPMPTPSSKQVLLEIMCTLGATMHGCMFY